MQLTDLLHGFLQPLIADEVELNHSCIHYATFSNTGQCFYCAGFYATCEDQQFVCTVCHTFLCPDTLSTLLGPIPLKIPLSDKSDSEDSGNEDTFQGPDTISISGGYTSAGSSNINFDPQDPLNAQLRALSQPRMPWYDHIVSCAILESIPLECLLKIFSFLDDLSLWCCAHACHRWMEVVKCHTTAKDWQRWLRLRWPLYRPLFSGPKCWFRIYSKLVRSTTCLQCLRGNCMSKQAQKIPNSRYLMMHPRWQETFDDAINVIAAGDNDQQQSSSSMSASTESSSMQIASSPPDAGWRSRRLFAELKTLQADPPDGIEAKPLDRALSRWMACVVGPPGSPYEGGKFYLLIQVPQVFPMRPPTVRFLTKIYHPNVSRHGDVGLDVLLNNWSPGLSLSKVLLSVQSLLADPFSLACMEPEIGQLYHNHTEIFRAVATAWTWHYAICDSLVC